MAGKRSSRRSIPGRRGGERRTGSARRATGSDFLAGGGEMGGRIREHDWSATPLGPVETWPQSLRSAVSILLPSRAQIVLFWGPEFIAIYNDAYAPVFGAKHPWALGGPPASAGARCGTSSARSSRAWSGRGGLLGERPPLPSPPPGIPRRDVLRRLVRSGPHRERQRRRCLLHRQRADRARPRRTASSDPAGARREDGGREEPAEVCREAVAALAMDPADVPFSLLYLIDGAGLRAELVGVSGVEGDDLALGRDVITADVGGLAAAREGRATAVETGVFVGRAPATSAERVLVLPISSGTQISGALVAGVSRFLRLSRGLPRLLRPRGRARLGGDRQRARVRGGKPPRRGPGRAGSGQDRLLQQREPRVPHAAHAHARPVEELLAKPGDHLRGRPGAAHGRPAQRPAAAEAREHAARLLAHRGRPRPGRVRADRPGRVDGRAGQQLPLGLRAGRALAGRGLPAACPSRSTWTARCGRRSSSTSCPTPSSSPSKARSRSILRPRRARPWSWRSATPASASRPRRSTGSSSGSTGSRTREGARRGDRHRAGAGAGAGRAPRRLGAGRERGRPGKHVHRVHPDRHGPPPGRPDRECAHAGLDRAGAGPYVAEALRWLSDAGIAPARRRWTVDTQPGRAPECPGPHPLADDNADMRDYVRRC